MTDDKDARIQGALHDPQVQKLILNDPELSQYADRLPDPNFPDRPQHPDLWKMSEAVIALDALVDNGSTVEEVGDAHDIDFDSVTYMATQRAARASAQFQTPPSEAMRKAQFAANWIDGFMAGLHVGHAKEVEKQIDGNRRQGGKK